jgi:hypothetical protein
MGFFSLKKKKKAAETEACGDKKGKSLSKSESSQFRGRDTEQLACQLPSLPLPDMVCKKPILKINTAPLTPSPTPSSSSHSPQSSSSVQKPHIHSQQWDSTPRIHFNPDPQYPLSIPPQSPKASLKSPSPRRKSLASLFESPKKQRLREAREGKRPAIPSDHEVYFLSPDSESEGQMTSDIESLTEGICDPSSSTIYNPVSERRRKPRVSMIKYCPDKDVLNTFKSPGIKMSIP